ncbi:hypothetical protein TREMEDRAFT_68014 [Tremella mesenterica DSM 1558]|uniref:uncharacterized protein n=1 Tax=Tremella mesenterica (strain ATCC 24925 / CBS 8224 / DSM 1558 / NBRC 9311 / NRRL Y-6157 / RJB 2259-6 / UBC 559-6) TaxID=578456 RepID=UPI0003F4A49F|nr:uncharacterized protein TREMEDRAFT_68014 [Tremella mesenterica DSM 1558]EIW70359.1 hypothetical protein TREMEDRAFT_68014 [Tremella mesenterica DSM 1558]
MITRKNLLTPYVVLPVDLQDSRFAALYLASILLVLPISLTVACNKILLTPLYNSLPLTLNREFLYILVASLPTLLYWRLTLHSPARYAISARVCFSVIAASTEFASIFGRRIGGNLGTTFGPVWGGFLSRFILGAGVMGGGISFALLCFDHISPLRPSNSPFDQHRHLLQLLAQATAYAVHIWLAERMASDLLSSRWLISFNPEKIILVISIVLTTCSFFLMPSTSPSFPDRLERYITTRRSLTPTTKRNLNSILSRLPSRGSTLLLAFRIPLILLALRTQFLRPLPPYVAIEGNLRILSSERGITGQVVVAENIKEGYRFLRCDHSTLGGRWVRHTPNKSGENTQFGDSVFAAFALQEVALLANRHKQDDGLARTLELTTDIELDLESFTQSEENDRALIIGLGVGIAANTFVKRSLNVDIVEIDPLVYTAAEKYFDLPPPTSKYIMDGTIFVHSLATLSREGQWNGTKYSYVIQDCFSGGVVTSSLFTKEFWEDLKEIMLPDGVVVMNSVGLLDSKSMKAVVTTFSSSFPQCRSFSDIPPETIRPNEPSNLMVFCYMAESPLLTFREPTIEDVMRSPLRSHVYSTFLSNEIPISEILQTEDEVDSGLMITSDNPLKDEWQLSTSISMWYAMRKILTPEMWMAY